MQKIRVRIDTLIPQLGKIQLFRYLPEESVRHLLDCSSFVECDDGERFITEHSVESTVYVILSGSCAVMVDREGQDTYVTTLGPGQVVGEAAIFANLPRTASVVSKGASRLMCFERSAFLGVLRDEPEAGVRILFVMVHNLLGKLREVNLELAFERKDDASQDDVDALIASLTQGTE